MNVRPGDAELFDRNVPHDCRHELFGGRGAVRVWSLTTAPVPPFTAVLACELEPGAIVGAHVQQHYPELVIAISGSGSIAVGAEVRAFRGGQVVYLPLGETLAIDNAAGHVALRYLIIKAFASA